MDSAKATYHILHLTSKKPESVLSEVLLNWGNPASRSQGSLRASPNSNPRPLRFGCRPMSVWSQIAIRRPTSQQSPTATLHPKGEAMTASDRRLFLGIK